MGQLCGDGSNTILLGFGAHCKGQYYVPRFLEPKLICDRADVVRERVRTVLRMNDGVSEIATFSFLSDQIVMILLT